MRPLGSSEMEGKRGEEGRGMPGGIIQLTDGAALDDVLGKGTAVVYKHSAACWICAMAWRQIRRFARRAPEVPIFVIDILEQRALSDEIAERLGIRHESPQVIVIRDGEPIWHGSHLKVTASALQAALDGA